MAKRVAVLGWLLLALLGFAPAAVALESAPVVTRQSTATLVTESDSFAGKPFRAGLRLRMAKGWHSYWKNPGDAGAATELAFTGLPGLQASEIAWPTPALQRDAGLTTYGYEGDILLPVTLTATAAGTLTLHATWLICEKVCIPEQGDFTLALPPGGGAPSAQAELFAAGDRATPQSSPWPAVVSDGELRLTGAGLTADSVRKAWFIPAGFDTIKASAPQTLTVTDGSIRLALQIGPAFKPDAPLEGVLVLQDGRGQQTALAIAAPSVASDALPLWRVLLMAFAGGLILNLMPCVFPVLAVKAVGLAKLARGHRSYAYASAGGYAAGVLVTFCGLGFGLLVLQHAGAAVGWGSQFQSPAFVAAMAWVLFGVGLSLSGVFHVNTAAAGMGHELCNRSGAVGSFFSGLLAVLVATPCTAPFMGVAVATALSGTPTTTMAIFTAMGAGLAGPYVAIACIPGAAGLMPRPGRWMDVLKQALAFPMYAAAVWMLWTISLETGPVGVVATAGGLVLIGLAAWLVNLDLSGFGRRLAKSLAVLALAACVLLLVGIAQAPAGEARTVADASGSEPYSATRLAALRAEGRPVFVNMTAAWCITCLVNERVALGTAKVKQAFASGNVAYLKGDWTREDPAISAFLHAHGRDGVPLYIFFPANGRPPVLLPQLLTQGIVLNALGAL